MKKKPQPPRRPPPPPPPVPAAGPQPGGSVIGLVGTVGRYVPPSPPPAHKAPPAHRKPVPHKKPAAHKKPVKRKLALGEAVACCAAEALAASLRLTGWRVTDEDVLALYEMTADGPDEGATILATLEAAAEYGLAGSRPQDVHELDAGHRWPPAELEVQQHHPELHPLHLGEFDGLDDVAVALLDRDEPSTFPGFNGHGGDVGRGDPALVFVHTLILGLDLPGPHALCDDGTAWWSWGQPYDPADFPLAIIEEAWQVTW